MSDNSKIRNMEQFAAASGLSRSTVSRFFNDPESVKKSTRAKIEEAMELFDYQPNIYAINQNRQLSKTIGIVIPYLSDPFFAEHARNLESHCINQGYSPLLFNSNGNPDHESDILDMLRSMKAAGLLIAPLGRVTNKSRLERFSNEVPTVLFDSNIEGIGQAFVGSDNPQMTETIVGYLCRTSEPPCYFEMRKPPNPNTRKRKSGYLKVMEEHGFEPQIISVDGDGWDLEEIGFQGGLKTLSENSLKSNTVFCTNDRLAIGFLSACHKSGLKVGVDDGCDIRIAGLDDHPFSKYTSPALTTVAHDYKTVASEAARTLFEIIQDGQGTLKTRSEVYLEGKFVLRESS